MNMGIFFASISFNANDRYIAATIIYTLVLACIYISTKIDNNKYLPSILENFHIGLMSLSLISLAITPDDHILDETIVYVSAYILFAYILLIVFSRYSDDINSLFKSIIRKK